MIDSQVIVAIRCQDEPGDGLVEKERESSLWELSKVQECTFIMLYSYTLCCTSWPVSVFHVWGCALPSGEKITNVLFSVVSWVFSFEVDTEKLPVLEILFGRPVCSELLAGWLDGVESPPRKARFSSRDRLRVYPFEGRRRLFSGFKSTSDWSSSSKGLWVIFNCLFLPTFCRSLQQSQSMQKRIIAKTATRTQMM